MQLCTTTEGDIYMQIDYISAAEIKIKKILIIQGVDEESIEKITEYIRNLYCKLLDSEKKNEKLKKQITLWAEIYNEQLQTTLKLLKKHNPTILDY